MTDENTIAVTFDLATKNWERGKKPHPHFNEVPSCNHIKLGHRDGMDIIAMAPSLKPNTDWSFVSTAFEMKVGKLRRFSGDWNNSLQIRFDQVNRKRLIAFVVDLFSIDSKNIDESFDSILSEWKSFFDQWGAPLSPEVQLGLMGELFVLEKLLDHGTSSRTLGWLGPDDSLHDFETEDWHIEVKSSLRPNPVALIHPIGQLDAHNNPFNLVIVKLQRGEDITLPEKIRQMSKHGKIQSSATASAHYQKMLERINYDPSDDRHYSTKYSKDVECIRLDINSATTVLWPSRIDSKVKIHNLRWQLLASDHNFIACDDNYWADPV